MAETKIANLALQGGGSHGAFTWGVLERLLEEPRLEIDGVSATSAGAMNAAVLAHGLTVGGREGARRRAGGFLATGRPDCQVEPSTALVVRPPDP